MFNLNGGRASIERRIFGLALIDGSGTGIQNVLVGVAAAERFGVAAAGLVIGLLSLGRFASPLVFWLTDRHPAFGSEETHTLFKVSVTIMTLTSIGSVFAAVLLPPWVVVVVGLLWALSNSVSSVIATSAVPRAITGYGPFSMVGVAFGAWVAAVVASGSNAEISLVGMAAVSIVLAAQMVEPILISGVKFVHVSQPSIKETTRHATKGFLLAAVAYGPLMVYQALTLQIASVAWVGWAMVVYAAGALTAIPLSRRLRGPRTFAGVLFLGAVGVGVWTFAVSGPLLLLTRFVSGAALFVAQGRLLQMAFGENAESSTARLAGSSTGLGVGASLGAIVAAALAQRYSVSAMGAALGCAAGVTATLVFLVSKALRMNRQTTFS